MARIKNMGHSTVRFNEGVIVSGSAGSDTPSLVVTGSIALLGDLYVDKIRRATDSGTTTKILLNDEAIKLYAGHSSDNICTIDSTGLTIDNGSLETATIDYTDGDLSMTIADGGEVTFAAGFNVGSDAAGDILYHNGTSYIRLAKGTADQVLTMNDAATAPGWEAASGGGGSSSNRTMFMGYVSLQQGARPVSYDYTNLGTGANNNYKGFLIVPFDGTLDTIIVSTKGDTVNDTNFGDITVTAYKNQHDFATGTAVVVNGDAFGQKASGTPKVYSGIFDFSLAVSQGDLIQIKVGRGAGGTTDLVVTIVFTES